MSKAKYIDNWESYTTSHDDKLKEYIEGDDVTLKAKYSFYNKFLKLSAKTKLNSAKENAKFVPDYTLTFNFNPDTSFFVNHKQDSVMLDGNFSLWKQDTKNLTLFANLFRGKRDNKDQLTTHTCLRYNQNNDQIFSLGFDKFDFNNKTEDPYVLYLSYVHGGEIHTNTNLYGGYRFGFNVGNFGVNYHRFLLGIKDPHFTAFLESTIFSKLKQTYDLRATAKVNKDLSLMTKLSYEHNETVNKFEADLVGEYLLEEGTRLKGKVNQNGNVTLGLIHNYNKLVNFCLTATFKYDAPAKKDSTTITTNTTSKEVSNNNAPTTDGTSVKKLETSFGVFIEFNDA